MTKWNWCSDFLKKNVIPIKINTVLLQNPWPHGGIAWSITNDLNISKSSISTCKITFKWLLRLLKAALTSWVIRFSNDRRFASIHLSLQRFSSKLWLFDLKLIHGLTTKNPWFALSKLSSCNLLSGDFTPSS